MEDIDRTVDALLASPLGCAFLIAIDESRKSTAQAAEPATTFALAAQAVSETEIWHSGHEELVPQVLDRGRRLGSLARSVLQEPGAAWWFEPADLRNQLCVWPTDRDEAPSPSAIRPSDQAPAGLEGYAQKPPTVWTSTVVGGEACMRTFIDNSASDWIAREYPLRQWLLRAEGDSRVYEITGPDAWHALCVRYPARVGDGAQGLDHKWPDRERLTVDWQAAAADWDGVHLTFGGLLTSEQVPRSSAEGWSVMWGWASEMTVWLRWMFDEVERLPDHERQERRDIRFPMIRTRETRSNRYFGPPGPPNVVDRPEPPVEAPAAHLLVFDGNAYSEQVGALHHRQWPKSGERDLTGDDPPDWPTPLEVREGMRTAVRLDTPSAPVVVEVRTFDELGADGVPIKPLSTTRCATVQFYLDDAPCSASMVERSGSLGWELELPVPEEAGHYYFAVWTEWIGKDFAFSRCLATWLFAVERV